MAKLANLTAFLLHVVMAMATISSVHSTHTLERVDQVTILESSTVAKPPSSTLLEVEALLPCNGLFEEAAEGPITDGYRATDCTRKTPVLGP
ncbi:hypothetical protein BDA96_01G028600 [Sorghum bicolor]|jgi:hypothetical protein|uniref:Uncharacterized protein n=2 Tax=Sorghum bicolor TaxID=4558 RepID=A0A921RVC8_SORBI|nr:hypothetical protein BDA96_01G028600 [Sorghum bicolor]KXG37216.1 hypothetical protein SORBI_3001G027400 [Sorghum bicolor]